MRGALGFTPGGPCAAEGHVDARRGALTVLKDPLHVQPVGGARLVVGTPLQVAGELPRPGVVDDPWVSGTYGIWNRQHTVTISSPVDVPPLQASK